MIPPSTPIDKVSKTLGITVSLPTHVRTAHDLLVALKRGEVDVPAAVAKKIRDEIHH
jgi:hypothetical protein